MMWVCRVGVVPYQHSHFPPSNPLSPSRFSRVAFVTARPCSSRHYTWSLWCRPATRTATVYIPVYHAVSASSQRQSRVLSQRLVLRRPNHRCHLVLSRNATPYAALSHLSSSNCVFRAHCLASLRPCSSAAPSGVKHRNSNAAADSRCVGIVVSTSGRGCQGVDKTSTGFSTSWFAMSLWWEIRSETEWGALWSLRRLWRFAWRSSFSWWNG